MSTCLYKHRDNSPDDRPTGSLGSGSENKIYMCEMHHVGLMNILTVLSFVHRSIFVVASFLSVYFYRVY